MTSKLKPLTREEVKFEVEVEADDSEVDFQSGDPEYKEADDKLEEDARKRLDQGDYWAWCFVTVTARWGSFSGTASIGGCSYIDEDDFEKDGYAEDLKVEALARLNSVLESIYEQLKAREESCSS